MVGLASGCLSVPSAIEDPDGGGGGSSPDAPLGAPDASPGCPIELGFNAEPGALFELYDDDSVSATFDGELALSASGPGRAYLQTLDAYPFGGRRLVIQLVEAEIPAGGFAGIGLQSLGGQGVRFGVRGEQLVLEICEPIGVCSPSVANPFVGPVSLALHQLAGVGEVRAEVSEDGEQWELLFTQEFGAGVDRRIYAGMWVEEEVVASATLDALRLCSD
jgi:hypothetical protein